MKTINWKKLPAYAWLFALYAILFLFSQNIGEVFESDVLASIGVAILGVSIVFGLAFLFSRNQYKAGAITAIFVAAFFSYGHVVNLTAVHGLGRYFLSVGYIVLTIGGIVLIVRARDASPFERSSPYINLVALVLLIMALPPLLGYYYRSYIHSAKAAPEEVNGHPQYRDSAQLPDIYYIVMDAYSNDEHLRRDYGYDNSAFTQALENRGFFVAKDSKTSYGVTLVSLSAALNMRYIDENDVAAAKISASDGAYFRDLMSSSTVAMYLQTQGYTYIYMMSGFTGPSRIAEMNIDFHPSGPIYYNAYHDNRTDNSALFYQRPFIPLMLESTALYDFADAAAEARKVDDKPYEFWRPERALMTWDETEKIPELPQATFTIIHIIKPHEPIAFNRDGSLIPYPYIKYSQPHDLVQAKFFEQLEFVNDRTLRMLDTIIKKSSNPPIIIIQGDHGSDLGRPESRDHRRTNFEILNAYYFPGHSDCVTDPGIIPINSFRALFNCYFGEHYEMLEAKYYAMPSNYDNLFDLEPIDINEWMLFHHVHLSTDPATP